jgi:hypothetical protein
MLFLSAFPAQHLTQLAPQQAQEQQNQQDDATCNTNITALCQVRKLLPQLLESNAQSTMKGCRVGHVQSQLPLQLWLWMQSNTLKGARDAVLKRTVIIQGQPCTPGR